MPLNPEDLYKYHEYLVDEKYFKHLDDPRILETILRDAISKIYYSIIHHIVNKYNITGIETNFHSYVISNVDKSHKSKLNNMRRNRTIADYELQRTITYDDVNEQKRYYEFLIDKV